MTLQLGELHVETAAQVEVVAQGEELVQLFTVSLGVCSREEVETFVEGFKCH